MASPILLAVPNVSEGRSAETIAAIGDALAGREAPPPAEAGSTEPPGARAPAGARLLDVHSDPDHHRSVYTLAARPEELSDALLRGAAAAVALIDVMDGADAAEPRGQHPHVGALDVAPVVYLDTADRGAACAEALVLADRIGSELGVPVFLYGELSAEGSAPWRSRAELRRGGVQALAARMAGTDGEPPLRPDFGPGRLHASAGATLVAAREPLVAFNLQLASPATIEQARAIAASIREGGELGMPGLRAIGVALGGGVAQVSMNIERPLELPLAVVVEAVRRHAQIASAELVGLAPAVALAGFPEDVPMPGFDPARHVIENALGCW
jgi:glutamate formiminotransferase/glutamate formiminotransferase/formiminotetrahydrofolate cyclodeaminase